MPTPMPKIGACVVHEWRKLRKNGATFPEKFKENGTHAVLTWVAHFMLNTAVC
jgi:hypothetical protein